jgi:hypothetical protein
VLPTDTSILRDRLAELAEVFDKKPVGDKALRVWFDTLREFPCEDVMSMLLGWPKTRAKFPVPSEVWKAMNERGIDRREEKAARERAENHGRLFLPTPRGKEFLAKIKAMLKAPRLTPIQHWHRVLATAAPGSIGERYAREALAKLEPQAVVEREPGEDLEEDEVVAEYGRGVT